LSAKEAQAPAASTSKVAAKPSPDPESEFEFSDVATLMCLLCARQFKTLDVLKRHNKESDLHKVRMHFKLDLCKLKLKHVT
jgi:RNA-binding protein 5/10